MAFNTISNAHTPAKLYVYATCNDGNWSLSGTWSSKAEVKLEEPRFGAAVPYIVIPMSEIFAAVYMECKKLLKE